MDISLRVGHLVILGQLTNDAHALLTRRRSSLGHLFTPLRARRFPLSELGTLKLNLGINPSS